MAVNAAKVLVGAPDQATTGAICVAPLGTTLPTSAIWTPATPFIDSGYVSEDGLELAPDISTADIRDWSGALVRRLLDTFDGTLTWSMIQLDEASAKIAFGDENVTVTPATKTHGTQLQVDLGATLPAPRTWVFRMKDGDNRMLIVVGNGQITTVDTIPFKRAEPIALPVTLSCYPSPLLNGKSIRILTDDGQVSEA